MTELDQRLQEIAINDWPRFQSLVGGESLMAAKICLLKSENKSFGEIMQRLNITIMKARWQSDKCNCKD